MADVVFTWHIFNLTDAIITIIIMMFNICEWLMN